MSLTVALVLFGLGSTALYFWLSMQLGVEKGIDTIINGAFLTLGHVLLGGTALILSAILTVGTEGVTQEVIDGLQIVGFLLIAWGLISVFIKVAEHIYNTAKKKNLSVVLANITGRGGN